MLEDPDRLADNTHGRTYAFLARILDSVATSLKSLTGCEAQANEKVGAGWGVEGDGSRQGPVAGRCLCLVTSQPVPPRLLRGP